MINRLQILLLSIFTSLASFAAYSGYVGDYVDLKVSVSASDIYSIEWKEWSGSTDCVTLTQNWGNDATVHIDSYFTGTVRIRAQYKTKSNAVKTEYFDISCNAVTLTPNHSSLDMKVNDEEYVTYDSSPSGKWPSVTYSSSDMSVASVDYSTGLVTAKAKGSATITLSNSMGPKATVSVSVDGGTDGGDSGGGTTIKDGDWFQDKTIEGYNMLFCAYTNAYTGELCCAVTSSLQGISTIAYANGKVTIPSYAKGVKVTKINNNAFHDLDRMTELVIPSTVAYIGPSICNSCPNLTKLTCEATTPPSAYSDSFGWSLRNGTLYVPNGCVSKYQLANGWKEFKNIKEIGSEADILISSISLNESSTTLNEGDTKQLTATISPSNATNKSVTWSSSKTSVATVSNTGLVKAIGEGTATITCKANDGSGVSASCVVNVTNPNTIDINSANFPDANFRSWLLEQEYGKDGKLTNSDILNIKELIVGGKGLGIKSLQGIEFFTELTRLDCHFNSIESLSLSSNKALVSLDCSGNKLKEIDLSQNTNLEYLRIERNNLTTLDVSKNKKITSITIYYNDIRDSGMDSFINSLPNNETGNKHEIYMINILYDDGNMCTKSQVKKIKEKGWTPYHYDGEWQEYEDSEDPAVVEINSTNFPDANFSNWLLEQDYGKDGKLTEAEIENVTSIYVVGKNISTLKGIEYFTSLTRLDCASNQLTSLDVSKNTSLKTLWCDSNQLTSLDLSKNTVLENLHCNNNQLITLDVSKNTLLKELRCQSTQIQSIDVSKNAALETLCCNINQITSLYVSKNTSLSNLWVNRNQIGGKAMDDLISSLPFNSSGEKYEFHVISLSYDDEGNECTKSQVAAAKAKGWTPLCYNGSQWVEYEGSDEPDYDQGDVNMDNGVNGTDLVALSNIVLGRKEKSETADVNKDGFVNGTDIVALSNIILGRSNKAPRRAPETGATLSIESFDIKAGETKEMLIDLSNPNDEVTLVQFDLHLPHGLSIKRNGSDLDIDMAGRTSWRKHTLDANEVDGAYRFLLYSSGNTLIEGTNGAIIKVTLVASQDVAGKKIVIDNALLVSPDEKEMKPASYEIVIGSPSGISTVTQDAIDKNTHIYNLSGQKLFAPQKGINIINGKKVVMK